MAGKKDKNDLEAEVWNAITAFEQILEAMPNDRASLDALSHAYEQIGDLTKAKEYYVRLGNVLLDEGDAISAIDLLERLSAYAADDAEVADLIRRIRDAASGSEPESSPVLQQSGPEYAASPEPAGSAASAAAPESRKRPPVSTQFNMAEELAMAWNLMEASEITQEEYASVVQDLTEMSAGDSVSTISVLHVLEARGFKHLERIIAYLVRQCSTPFVSLSSFETPADLTLLVPVEFSVKRGGIVFELLGNDALAVVMNPFDKQLRKDVEAIAERKCHFFVTLPSEFDKAVEKANQVAAERKAAG